MTTTTFLDLGQRSLRMAWEFIEKFHCIDREGVKEIITAYIWNDELCDKGGGVLAKFQIH